MNIWLLNIFPIVTSIEATYLVATGSGKWWMFLLLSVICYESQPKPDDGDE